MTPYYDEGGIIIYHARCEDVLPFTDPDDVSLVLTDPPYGIGLDTDFSNLRGTDAFNAQKGHYTGKTHSPIGGDDRPFEPDHLLRFDRCVLFGADHFYPRLTPGGSFHCWDKRDGLNPNMLSDFELFWTSFSSGPSRLFRHHWLGYHRRSEVHKHYHPTQKPVALMRWILEKWSEPGDLILDPYMGSGPVAQACHEMGRRYIGIEIEEKYCEIAVQRLAQGVLEFQ